MQTPTGHYSLIAYYTNTPIYRHKGASPVLEIPAAAKKGGEAAGLSRNHSHLLRRACNLPATVACQRGA